MKKKRIITLLTLLMMLSFGSANAQFAVYDGAAHASNIQGQITRVSNYIKNSKILIEAIKTFKAIKQTKEMFQEFDDELKYVKNMIQTGKEISEIVSLVDRVSDVYQNNINFIVNDPFIDLETKDFIITVYTAELEKSISAFDTGDLLVSDNSYKMTDGERLNLLRNIKLEIEDHLGFIQYFDSKLKYSLKQNKSEYVTSALLSGGQNYFDIED